MGRRAVLKIYDGGHFDIYVGALFERAVRDQLVFFDGVLGDGKPPPAAAPVPSRAIDRQ